MRKIKEVLKLCIDNEDKGKIISILHQEKISRESLQVILQEISEEMNVNIQFRYMREAWRIGFKNTKISVFTMDNIEGLFGSVLPTNRIYIDSRVYIPELVMRCLRTQLTKNEKERWY